MPSFSTTNTFTQTQNDNSLVIDITAIQKTIEKQKQEIDGLTSKVKSPIDNNTQQQNIVIDLSSKVDSLSSLIETSRSNINTIADNLERNQETGQQAETKFRNLVVM
ncbi:MAG: hypothetical protein IPN15_20565 [Saprospiraceae bacterium]|nr:hypothetical protein [Candidatus Vicinibacter affinis]